MIQTAHSYWAYLVLAVLLLAVCRAISGVAMNKEYSPKMFQAALFALIVTHTQLLIAFLLYFSSSRFSLWFELGISEVMKVPAHRMYLVEHPITNILAIVLITMGWSLHKRQTASSKKFLRIALFYGLGLLFLLSRIPWNAWI